MASQLTTIIVWGNFSGKSGNKGGAWTTAKDFLQKAMTTKVQIIMALTMMRMAMLAMAMTVVTGALWWEMWTDRRLKGSAMASYITGAWCTCAGLPAVSESIICFHSVQQPSPPLQCLLFSVLVFFCVVFIFILTSSISVSPCTGFTRTIDNSR